MGPRLQGLMGRVKVFVLYAKKVGSHRRILSRWWYQDGSGCQVEGG